MKPLSKIKPLIAYAVVDKDKPELSLVKIFASKKTASLIMKRVLLWEDEKIIKVKIEVIE